MSKKAKPKTKSASSLLSVAITEEQRERWTEAAAADQRTLSSWVRFVLDKEASK